MLWSKSRMYLRNVIRSLFVCLQRWIFWFRFGGPMLLWEYIVFFYLNFNGILILAFAVCPNGTYWSKRNFCKPCPDANHITIDAVALNVSSCVCKAGFRMGNGNRSCEMIGCPTLARPENGYFMKDPSECKQVVNAACGARCKSGYKLVGTSIRLCQENGTWSGNEVKCECTFLRLLYTLTTMPIKLYSYSESLSTIGHSILWNGNVYKFGPEYTFWLFPWE